MCKANDSIITKVSDLMELRKMIEELQDEAEALTDEIKDFMGEEETMMAGTWKAQLLQQWSKLREKDKKLISELVDSLNERE